jgi:hypothetical protein
MPVGVRLRCIRTLLNEKDILKLKECTIELGLSWDKKGEAGVEFYVFKLGGGIDKTNTETLSVTLEPLGVDPVILGVR